MRTLNLRHRQTLAVLLIAIASAAGLPAQARAREKAESRIQVPVQETIPETTFRSHVTMSAQTLRPLHVNGMASEVKSTGAVSGFRLKPSPNYFVDANYRVTDQMGVTGGMSYSDLPMTTTHYLRDQNLVGVGASLSYSFKDSFLSLVSLGAHHYPTADLTNFLWSLSF